MPEVIGSTKDLLTKLPKDNFLAALDPSFMELTLETLPILLTFQKLLANKLFCTSSKKVLQEIFNQSPSSMEKSCFGSLMSR